MADVGERGARGGRGRPLAVVLAVAALVSPAAFEHARAGLTGPGRRAPDPAIRLVEPQPWQAFRAGSAVRVVVTAAGSECTVGWDDGTLETLPARGGECAASRVVRRPGLYTVSVAPGAGDGTGTELRVPVVVYDPRAARTRGSGESRGLSFSVEAGYVPWRRTPAPSGTGSFEGPGGLSATVAGVDWVLVTPERTTAVKGTAVAADGTAYGFVLVGQGFDGRTDPLRLTDWRRLPATGRPG